MVRQLRGPRRHYPAPTIPAFAACAAVGQGFLPGVAGLPGLAALHQAPSPPPPPPPPPPASLRPRRSALGAETALPRQHCTCTGGSAAAVPQRQAHRRGAGPQQGPGGAAGDGTQRQRRVPRGRARDSRWLCLVARGRERRVELPRRAGVRRCSPRGRCAACPMQTRDAGTDVPLAPCLHMFLHGGRRATDAAPPVHPPGRAGPLPRTHTAYQQIIPCRLCLKGG